MAKQVNVSYDCVSDSMTYWTSEWSADGYKGRLTDTVYEDGASWTDWCVYTSENSADVTQFVVLCETEGLEKAKEWAERLRKKSYQRFLNQLKKV